MKKKRTIWLMGSLLLSCLGLIWVIWSVPIEHVTITGNVYHSDEEINSILFPENSGRSSIYYFLKEQVNNKMESVFLEDYTMVWTDIDTVEVTVKEKNFLGYVEYMGSNLYFDEDGVVIYSSNEIIERVPLVQGISFQQLIMYQKLNIVDENIFSSLIELTRMLHKYEIYPEKIRFCVNNEVNLYIDNITVQLGRPYYLEGKVQELSDMLDALMKRLNNRGGVLHLENYNGENPQKTYYFSLDTEEESSEEALDYNESN
ncbi:MAG: cell division protein FtsQ/DivIB [Lachnospiraceae bacterium]